MDLKRAWRNGFLVLVIFAIPLSDLYYRPFSNLIADDTAKNAHVEHAKSCGSGGACPELAGEVKDDIAGVPSSWDNGVDENSLTIPGNILADLLPDSAGTDFSDLQEAVVQFDPQDIFLSEPIRGLDTNTFKNAREHGIANFGPGYAPGFSGPFSPAMFSGAGKSANAGLHNASGNDSETPFVDPIRDSSTESETGNFIDTATDTTTSGIGDASLHNVPEPSSFILALIGTLSVVALLYRKSKTSSPLS